MTLRLLGTIAKVSAVLSGIEEDLCHQSAEKSKPRNTEEVNIVNKKRLPADQARRANHGNIEKITPRPGRRYFHGNEKKHTAKQARRAKHGNKKMFTPRPEII